MVVNPEKTERLFHQKYILDKSGCWNWTAFIHYKGYGRFNWHYNGKYQANFAHRYSYERFIGKLKKHMTIDHLCKNKKCVNPIHLEQVTWRENLIRGDTMCGRNVVKTHCPQGHEYNSTNTNNRTIRSKRKSGVIIIYNVRACRRCECVSSKKYYYKTKNES